MGSSLDWMKWMAAKQVEDLLNNPAHQAAMRHLEEMERNPALKMLYKQMEEQARSPLFHVSRQVMRDLDRLTANEHLRVWEKRIPDWVLNAKPHATPGLGLTAPQLQGGRATRSEPAGPRRARQGRRRHCTRQPRGHPVGRDEQPRGFEKLARRSHLSREISDLFRSLPPEAGDTLLGQTARRLDAIRESAERQDAEKFDQEVAALAEHLLGWVGSILPHSLTSEGMLHIILAVLLTLAQIGVSYKWRIDDQREAERREQARDEKLDTIVLAVRGLEENRRADVGKPYRIERTTAVFSRPGPKRPRVGYVYAGQRVRAIATTGRWLFIEYADPFNLELRAGWIRKKYASIDDRPGIKQTSERLNTTRDTELEVTTGESRLIIEPVPAGETEGRRGRVGAATKRVMENHDRTLRRLAE